VAESEQTSTVDRYDDEIDLRELFAVLWAGKWLIGGGTVAAAVVSIIVALMLPNIYRAEALLAPNDQEGAGGLSALAAQYGGLASLAGIELGGSSSDKTVLGLEILKSRKFVSEFIERHELLVPLMAAKKWDSEKGQLIIDPDEYDITAKRWVRDVRSPKKTIPSLQEAYEQFREVLSVSQDKQTGFVTVAVEHYSPTVAKQWVDWLINDLNSSIMHQDVAEAEQAIRYLNKQIEATSLSGLKDVFFSLIEEQTKTIMLAKVSDEYLLKTLDPAIAPEEKSKPRRILIVGLGGVFGCFFAMIIVIVRSSMRTSNNSNT
jgi:uncharacterized protein involved in exopolysaccharide biosynthesis